MHLIISLLYILVYILTHISCTICFDHHNPLDPSQQQLVLCSDTEDEVKNSRQRRSDASAFQIDFTCYANDRICRQARQAFDQAGIIISQAIAFKTPVTVNATFVPFCQTLGQCPKGHMITLGGSYPARTAALAQSDGIVRLYPQALVKQLDLHPHPAYAHYDIVSLFNADASFWFEEDGPIEADQSDFLFVILHEFMHGLGFYSNWQNYIRQLGVNALTPDLSALLQGERLLGINETSGEIVLTSALESVFDQFIVTLPDMKSTSSLTRKFNQVRMRRKQSFLQILQQSGVLDEAQAMYQLGTTSGSLGFVAPNSSSVTLVLETALSPFQSGSSISHVDYALYGDSADFLMRFMQERGLTLAQAMARSSSSSPIGPNLRQVLQSIGYTTIDYQQQQQQQRHVRLNTFNSSGGKLTVLLSQLYFLMLLTCAYYVHLSCLE